MIKADEQTMPGSTWSNTHDQEPVFILCARDKSAPYLVRCWCQVATLIGVPSRKRHEAAELATMMEEWQRRNPEKVKTPD